MDRTATRIASREELINSLACGIEDQADRLTRAYKFTAEEAWGYFEELEAYCAEQARYYRRRVREIEVGA